MKNVFKYVLMSALLMIPTYSWADNYLVIINGKLVEAEAIVQPVAKITGTELPVALGEFAEVRVEITDSASKFIKSYKTSWKITQSKQPKRYFINQEGNPVIAAGVTNGVIIDIEANTEITYAVEDKTVLKTLMSKGMLTVGQVDPPKPPPDPPPTPTVVPDGFHGATRASYDIFKKDAVPALTKHKKETIIEAKQRFKANFYAISTKIMAGDYNRAVTMNDFVSAIFSDVYALNKNDQKIQIIDPDIEDYRTSIKKYIYSIYITDKFKNTSDWSDFFRAIGDSFDYE